MLLATILLLASVPALGQVSADGAWAVLQSGLEDKGVGQRAAAVRVLGLLENNPKAAEHALGATHDSATGFATELGGGLDFEVNERLAIRLLDASASITRIEQHTHVKPKLAFGLVFHFGRKENHHTGTTDN
jgi:hypothetical protein